MRGLLIINGFQEDDKSWGLMPYIVDNPGVIDAIKNAIEAEHDDIASEGQDVVLVFTLQNYADGSKSIAMGVSSLESPGIAIDDAEFVRESFTHHSHIKEYQ